MKAKSSTAAMLLLVSLAACVGSSPENNDAKTPTPLGSRTTSKISLCELIMVLEGQHRLLEAARVRVDAAGSDGMSVAAGVDAVVTQLLSSDWSQTDPRLLQLALAWADVGSQEIEVARGVSGRPLSDLKEPWEKLERVINHARGLRDAFAWDGLLVCGASPSETPSAGTQ